MFKRVLVANRGEIARRIIRACKNLGVETVAVYSEADADAVYLNEATEAVHIGPAASSQSYLNQDAILKAALQTECQALHPGYGFLSENAGFATRCNQQKLTFIGPKPYQIRLMGDKSTARETMRKVGLKVTQGSQAILEDDQSVLATALEVGFPVLLKATAGGGGKGMRLVHTENELISNFKEAKAEASKAFGNDGVYLEKYLVGARHIEFQMLADSYGNVLHFGERECSIQRKHQKLLEESPAVGMSAQKRSEIGAKLCNALSQIGYLGAGTVEFLMDEDGELYFMEMNTRIQVEHPVTELVTGVDLVGWQIRIAAGEHLNITEDEIKFNGHAIECRINAEDPHNNFMPSPGVISQLRVPKNSPDGPVRFDSHLEEGSRISSHYDSMIGKLIVHEKDREAAIETMKKAIGAMVIEGVKTTLPLHEAILSNDKFIDGDYNCKFLEDVLTWPN